MGVWGEAEDGGHRKMLGRTLYPVVMGLRGGSIK